MTDTTTPNKRTPQLRDLNQQVTLAIFNAEHSILGPQITQSWSEVCRLEQEIASITDPLSMEGYFSRSGAVAAAFKAGNYTLASELADTYLSQNIPDQVAVHIRNMVRELRALEHARDENGDTMRALACDGDVLKR
jgi:hypothetical protein